MRHLEFLRGPRLVAVLTFLGVVAIVAITRQGIFSPGSLNAQAGPTPIGGVSTHASLSGQCSACHAPPFSKQTMSDLCLKCHTDVAQELKNPHTVHGMLFSSGQQITCTGGCHTEHQGSTGSLTLVNKEHVSGKTGYSLQAHKTEADGKTPFTCVDCHPAGLDTFALSTCTTCHQQIDPAFMQTHLNTFGEACLQCHDGIDTYGKAFDHSKAAFPLQGKHATISCSECHQGATSTAELKATPQNCIACHQKDDKHNGAFGQNCAQCHNAADWTQVTYDHSQTAFPLTGKHIDTACADCHVNNALKGTPTACNSCHQKDDQHNGALGTNCAQCHNTTDWKQVNFDHNQTSYPLTGKHASVACADCHANNTFKSTPTTCNSCHQKDDKHNGTLGSNCTQCHNTTDWKQANFDHSSTSFALTGKHVDTSCDACHTTAPPQNTPATCDACHQKDDKHNGTLGSNCAQCHNTTDWSNRVLKKSPSKQLT